ncbi:MAG TPA: hypothetical protein VD859_08000, partial [Nocardioides sp.]|nr:hypothetical protein [Nocardioides sp.]
PASDKNSGSGGDSGREDASWGEEPTWPPSFPHREIDALIERLDNGQSVEKADAYRLLSLVAKEAQRLRATALRLSTAKLAEADREAREIVAEALGHADAMRTVGLSILNTRLDEADRLLSTMREAFQVELRASELARAEERRRPSDLFGERGDAGNGPP